MRLGEVAHVRTGDKGDSLQVAVIAYREDGYPLLTRTLTAARIVAHLPRLGEEVIVVRHELATLGALLFVLDGALAGGVTRSLSLDAHGKTLGMQLLDLELEDHG